jgi:hypothetical protein
MVVNFISSLVLFTVFFTLFSQGQGFLPGLGRFVGLLAEQQEWSAAVAWF